MEFVRERHVFSPAIKLQLIALRELDNWHWIIAVLYDYAVIIAAILLFALNHWFYPLSLILIGSRQRALATILHESAHFCLAKSRRLNQFLGTWLSGYFILQEFHAYRDSHVKKHHAYLGDPERDPDYQYHIEQKLYLYQSYYGFFIQNIFKPLLLLKSFSYFIYLIQHRLRPNRNNRKGMIEMLALWMIMFYITWYFECLTYFIILWIVPLLTTAVLFGWFNELAEHYPLVAQSRNELYMTRNRFSHWLEHFLCNTHDENYHLVHHLQATIPFWNLRKAHAVMLTDPHYAAWNASMGGVFASSNQAPSLLSRFLMMPPISETGHVQYE